MSKSLLLFVTRSITHSLQQKLTNLWCSCQSH